MWTYLPYYYSLNWCSENQAFEWKSIMEDCKFKFLQVLVWVKNALTFDMTFGHKYMYKHKLCMFFGKGNKKLNNYDNTVFMYDKYCSPEHPTMKPLEMFMRIVKNSSNPKDLDIGCHGQWDDSGSC